MKQIKRVRKVGGSLMIPIDPYIIDSLRIKEQGIILADILRFDPPITKYRCKACDHIFSQSEQEPFCPACDREDLEIIEEEKNE